MKSKFPVLYNGKLWTKKECSEDFLCFYMLKCQLNGHGGVYMSEGDWIYPDGSIKTY
jgi:hypothetical protein